MAVLECDREAAAKATGIPIEQLQVITGRIKKACIAKGEQSWVEVCLEQLPVEEYQIILQLGLEARINSTGFSKIEKAKDQDGVEAAMEVAAQNIEKLYKGELRAPIGLAGMKKKAKTVSDRAVGSEALRLAKEEIKDRIRAAGEKVSHYLPKDITKAAKDLLEDDEFGPPIWAAAEKVVQERNKEKDKAAQATAKKGDAKGILSAMGIKVNAEMVKKAEAKTAKGKKAPPKGKGTEHRANA